jgi:hypothetical protein
MSGAVTSYVDLEGRIPAKAPLRLLRRGSTRCWPRWMASSRTSDGRRRPIVPPTRANSAGARQAAQLRVAEPPVGPMLTEASGHRTVEAHPSRGNAVATARGGPRPPSTRHSRRSASSASGRLSRKLGLLERRPNDISPAQDLLDRMAHNCTDFTLVFRLLCDAVPALRAILVFACSRLAGSTDPVGGRSPAVRAQGGGTDR